MSFSEDNTAAAISSLFSIESCHMFCAHCQPPAVSSFSLFFKEARAGQHASSESMLLVPGRENTQSRPLPPSLGLCHCLCGSWFHFLLSTDCIFHDTVQPGQSWLMMSLEKFLCLENSSHVCPPSCQSCVP